MNKKYRMFKNSIVLIFIFLIKMNVLWADIPTDANGNNLYSPPNKYNLLPLAVGILLAIGLTVGYFTYKNQKNANQ